MKNLYVLFLLLLMPLVSCSRAPQMEVSDQKHFRNIMDENHKIHKFLFENDTRLPGIKSLQDVLDQVQSKDPVFQEKLDRISTMLASIDSRDRMKFIKSYSAISLVYGEIIKTYNIKQYTRFYCSMEDNNWISSGFKIENPYSPEMRDCGEIIQE